MNNEPKDINMNIPAAPSGQPQPTPPMQTPQTTQVHTQPHNKMVFLITVTLVFGVISTVSLIFALRMKNKTPMAPAQEETTEVTTEVEEEMAPLESGQFDPKAKILELNRLNLEMVEEAYLDSILEE